MSSFCNLCHKDPDTGEYFCVRLGGKWVEKCPNFPDGNWYAREGYEKYGDIVAPYNLESEIERS